MVSGGTERFSSMVIPLVMDFPGCSGDREFGNCRGKMLAQSEDYVNGGDRTCWKGADLADVDVGILWAAAGAVLTPLAFV